MENIDNEHESSVASSIDPEVNCTFGSPAPPKVARNTRKASLKKKEAKTGSLSTPKRKSKRAGKDKKTSLQAAMKLVKEKEPSLKLKTLIAKRDKAQSRMRNVAGDIVRTQLEITKMDLSEFMDPPSKKVKSKKVIKK
jgi:hypothetical protein